MDGFIRRLILPDGYALVRPRFFLEDGYNYNVTRDGNFIAVGLAVAFSGPYPDQEALVGTDGYWANVQVGDAVTKIG